ncbi:chemotaxis protein CheA [Xenorhabdus szentirmaii]|uniref:Chemotaxis protein CheA n=2 Tax=Xenorhabdus szentirmaii TaxID=290112 RepID=W1J5B7_9GAMM|nr:MULTISPECIES: chemotaxis protein CheA [Xenorhabdus]MBD2792423.1 chemotaxis protein CheA [Xenorhabdus sp. CUL]MBD2799693.1 chemotaxis protein CheA [Xenorhabdus sp. M]MBD2803260.1 chemotaxis protein CheA [Xenorhabdus sp. ZM]MBD2824892.1 chemotaxis protein CheA [Xenorhabdus sp. 5]PHM31874.1 chemotaxis protein CheA [Xenorhabdus szentirmaii DSM 16338]
MDITAFYQTFFDEADELLADMEQHLLLLNADEPDHEQLNAIFRSAHSIKGGAATFGFTKLQQTTHVLENLLDSARRGEMRLTIDIINLFLEAKDIMQQQLDAYKSSQEPDEDTFNYICETLRQLALELQEDKQGQGVTTTLVTQVEPVAEEKATPVEETQAPTADQTEENSSATTKSEHGNIRVHLSGLKEREVALMKDELAHLGDLYDVEQTLNSFEASLITSATEDDITAVLCFVIEPEQITFLPTNEAQAESTGAETEKNAAVETATEDTAVKGNNAVKETVVQEPAPKVTEAASEETVNKPAAGASQKTDVREMGRPAPRPAAGSPRQRAESSSIRVAVEKVDQLINLVGELVITQSMLAQHCNGLEPTKHSELLSCMTQLQRNSRDLQESVMSIRMMPMEYVFSRYPRLVRDLAGKLNKKVELTLVGSSTELDKSLIERIIDPLTHLVRNSLDHGIESPEKRLAAGKSETGNLTLAAEHQGGNICIEVIDDGAGLNREKILAKAQSQGLSVNENMSNEEVAMLIFAPGFSTAEVVTDVSGRGVGMDVVKRNIQDMGGQIQINFQEGKGTVIRILLPLTLAILDGMSVQVNNEVFILPLSAVVSSLQPQDEDIYPLAGDEKLLQVRGEYLPLLELCRIFDIPNGKTDPTKGIVVIVQSAGRRYALLVDKLLGQHQVVVKNIESNYRKVPGISAATIMGDGSVALIIDIPALQKLNHDQLEDRKAELMNNK